MKPLVEEAQVFSRLEKHRQKCCDFLMSAESKQEVDLFTRMQEFQEWEELLVDMWTRLEIDARKGDPSFGLKNGRTPAENWIVNHVWPGLVFKDFLSLASSENKN